MWRIWIIFILFNVIIRKNSSFFEVILINFLVDCPPCLIIFFINNFHVYLQFHKICRYFMVAFILSFNINWLFIMANGILNFFSWKIFRMDTWFFIKFISIYTCLFSYVLTINRLFSSVIDLNFFSCKIFRVGTCFFIKIIRI